MTQELSVAVTGTAILALGHQTPPPFYPSLSGQNTGAPSETESQTPLLILSSRPCYTTPLRMFQGGMGAEREQMTFGSYPSL